MGKGGRGACLIVVEASAMNGELFAVCSAGCAL